MASKDEEKMKHAKDEKETNPQFMKQESALSVLGGEVAEIAASPAHQVNVFQIQFTKLKTKF